MQNCHPGARKIKGAGRRKLSKIKYRAEYLITLGKKYKEGGFF